MKIVLDTGCIDLFLKDRDGGYFSDFQQTIQKHELQGDDVCITIVNYGERMSGLKKILKEIRFPKKEEDNSAKKERDNKVRKINQIEQFLKIIKRNHNVLNISYKTAEIYSEIHHKLSITNNNISQGQLKSMHNDLWIASLCLESTCKLYTSDKDFEKIWYVDNNLNYKIVERNT